jgi:hypothetical protein
MIKVFEKFTEADYLKAKKKKEKRLIQKLGNKFIVDIVREGDFDGLNYLLDNGYDIANAGDIISNLFATALENDQFKMIEYLLQSNYANGWGDDSSINSISLPDIIGEKKYDGSKRVITPKMVEMLKNMVKYGYNFDSNYNLIELYLTETIYPNPDHNPKKILMPGVEPFIDWLLENHPENYKLCKNFLPDDLKKKYDYLEVAINYNI